MRPRVRRDSATQRHGCSRVAAPSRTLATRDTGCPLRTARRGCFGRMHACRAAGAAAPLRASATRMLSEECMPRSRVAAASRASRLRDSATRMQQSRCALAYARDVATTDASESLRPRVRSRLATRDASHVSRRRGCFGRMHACRAAESLRPRVRRRRGCFPKSACMPRSRVLSCKLRFDAGEPRALDRPSLDRRRAPSPLIPSPIYGIIYEFSDFWAQFWTIFKSTRPPSKS
jgi:hypothetical protein